MFLAALTPGIAWFAVTFAVMELAKVSDTVGMPALMTGLLMLLSLPSSPPRHSQRSATIEHDEPVASARAPIAAAPDSSLKRTLSLDCEASSSFPDVLIEASSQREL